MPARSAGSSSALRRLPPASRAISSRAKRRWPPSVRFIGTRPASPQRRSVDVATPSIALASWSESQSSRYGFRLNFRTIRSHYDSILEIRKIGRRSSISASASSAVPQAQSAQGTLALSPPPPGPADAIGDTHTAIGTAAQIQPRRAAAPRARRYGRGARHRTAGSSAASDRSGSTTARRRMPRMSRSSARTSSSSAASSSSATSGLRDPPTNTRSSAQPSGARCVNLVE